MTALDLDAIEAREKATTPGPWVHDETDGIGCDVWTQGETVMGGTVHTTDDGYPRGDYNPVEDALFIAHAKQDIPALVAEVRRLREVLADADAGWIGGLKP